MVESEGEADGGRGRPEIQFNPDGDTPSNLEGVWSEERGAQRDGFSNAERLVRGWFLV